MGRKIYKTPKADQLAMYVSPSYLDSSFAEYDIKKGSQAAPDVAAQLEKTDEASGQRLSPEAYQRSYNQHHPGHRSSRLVEVSGLKPTPVCCSTGPWQESRQPAMHDSLMVITDQTYAESLL